MDGNRPNVLIILSDQQRYDTIAAAGYPYMITPNLDRLAEEGCIFTNAYSTNPVCMPARHDLIMGMPSAAHGFFANCAGNSIRDYAVPTIPRIFTENGYRTAAIGKMHFSPARMHNGYSEMQLMEEIPRCRQDDDYAMFLKENGREELENIHGVRPYIYHEPQQAQTEDDLYETSWVSDRTIEWLKKNEKNPFMLCIGYIKPHPPWDVLPKYQGMYEGRNIPEAIERCRQYPFNEKEDPWYGDCDSPEHKRKIREAYYSSVTAVDESVGKILDYLRETGELDHTLVIYTSDHGEMLQDKGFYSKELPYESSVHIPFVVRFPDRFKKGTKDDRLIDLADIMPTCLDVAGLKYPEGNYHMYGSSLATDPSEGKSREFVISASGFLGEKRFVMCRNDRYKYIYWYNNGTEEWYDLWEDRQECHNMIKEMKGTELYRRFYEQVVSYEKKWGPKGAVENDRLIVIPGHEFHGSVSGKYHLWSNDQFQNFTELKKDDRLKEFDKELKKALGNRRLDDEFMLEEWQESYAGGREKYRSNKKMDV